MTRREAAAMIDISAVRTNHSYDDILEVVKIGKEGHFINVHVLPSWVKDLSAMIADADDVFVGAPVGFPSGGHCTETKLVEAKKLIEDGVEEMDIVMNVGRFKNGEYDYVKSELDQIIKLAHEAGRKVLTKVIIEINTLSDEEMIKACDIVMETKADFVKTGTGWVPGDANVERIRKMKAHCKDRIKIKAAGGVRTKEDFMQLVEMGVERMGINTQSAVEIVNGFDE